MEFYAAYASLHQLINMTEQLFQHIISHFSSNLIMNWNGIEIDFTGPWRIVTVQESINNFFGQEVDLNNFPQLLQLCEKKQLEMPEILTHAKVLDMILGNHIEPCLIQPTFLVGHPTLLSPLSKEDSKVRAK